MRTISDRLLQAAAFAAALLCATGLGAETPGQDWPRWRGPEGNGISRESGWNPRALSGQVRPAWTAAVGQGFSSPSIRGRYVYVLGNEKDTDTVWCLDSQTGKPLWRHSYGCSVGSYPGPRATPTVDGDTVYTLSREGHLFALDAERGRVRWQKHLVRDFAVVPPSWDFAGSPVVAGNLLVLNAGTAGLALDKTTGRKVWDSGRGPGGYAAPVLATIGGRSTVVIFGQRAVHGVALESGQRLWSFDWQTGSDVNAADPVVIGNGVFVSSAYGRGGALYDVSGSRPVEVWKSDAFESHFSSFVLLDGFLYGIDGDARQPSSGSLRCVEADTGKIAWTQRLGFGSLIAVDGYLVMLNSSGTIHIAQATPSNYREVSRAALPRNQYWTPPAFSQGRLFVRNLTGDLFAIDLR